MQLNELYFKFNLEHLNEYAYRSNVHSNVLSCIPNSQQNGYRRPEFHILHIARVDGFPTYLDAKCLPNLGDLDQQGC